MPKTNKPSAEERFRLAISLEDLDRIDPIQRANLLHRRLDLQEPIRLSRHSAEVIVLFRCSLKDAGYICDIIRSEDRKNGDSITRIYLQCDGGPRKRTGDNQVLIVQLNGVSSLNPILFQEPITLIPIARSKFKFGSE